MTQYRGFEILPNDDTYDILWNGQRVWRTITYSEAKEWIDHALANTQTSLQVITCG